MPQPILPSETLTQRLDRLHQSLLRKVSSVDRIACALYDAETDQLKTFINSTRVGAPINAYTYKLSDSYSLSQLASSGEFRVLDNINASLNSDTAHTKWVKEQGYQSSFTVPIYHGSHNQLLGFIFYDSVQEAAFTPELQRDLVLYSNLLTMAISNEIELTHTIVESTRVLQELSRARDFETGMHLERMARYALLIARALAKESEIEITDEAAEQIYLFAPLHDIGKIGIPDDVLLKPGKLNTEERQIMNTHVDMGVQIVDRIIKNVDAEHLPNTDMLRNIVSCHHEFLDHSGYPRGLKDKDIPIEARIVAVADIFDALTTQRPYKAAFPIEKSLEILDGMVQEGKLDERCVVQLRKNLREIRRIRDTHLDEDEPAPPEN
jgi:HD-GYP domain-containing protein (c-di-GMP phosphodiesterase class II)